MEEEKRCHCHEEECCCGDDCNCNEELASLEEKLVLVGKKDDEETKKAIDYLNNQKAEYIFMDLDDKDDIFKHLDFSEVKIPSLLLVQTLVRGVAPGIEGIKEVFED